MIDRHRHNPHSEALSDWPFDIWFLSLNLCGAPSVFMVSASKSIQRQSYQLKRIEFGFRFGLMEGKISYFLCFFSFAWFLTCLTGQMFRFSSLWIEIESVWIRMNCMNISNRYIYHVSDGTWNMHLSLLFQTIFQFIIRFGGSSRECSMENPYWNFPFQRPKALVQCANSLYFHWRTIF